MPTAPHQILVDAGTWTLLALAVALPVYAFLLNRWPWTRWGRGGRVVAGEKANWIDLLAALVLVYFFYFAIAASGASGKEESKAITRSLLANGLFMQLSLGGSVLVYLFWLRQRSLREWFGLNRLPAPAVVGLGAGFLLPALGLTMVTGWLVRVYLFKDTGLAEKSQEIVQTFATTPDLMLKAGIAGLAICAAPIVEEIVFRGFLYPVLKKYTDSWFAAPFTAMLFGLSHADTGSALPLAVLGLLQVIFYELTGTLLVPVLVHGLFNAFTIAMLLSAKSA